MNYWRAATTRLAVVKPRLPHAESGHRAARYMGRNAAGYMARSVAGVGRHYTAARLVKKTGVTMQALRACNWRYMRRKLIASGELGDELISGVLDTGDDGAGARGAGHGGAPPVAIAAQGRGWVVRRPRWAGGAGRL
jgi:hypothetical protein